MENHGRLCRLGGLWRFMTGYVGAIKSYKDLWKSVEVYVAMLT